MDYLPYGEKCRNSTLISGENDYLYGGKEFQAPVFNIPWYDSQARFQTTDGMFVSLDPQCEKYYSISPYAYCAGNPVRYVDRDGGVIETAWDIANVVAGVASFAANVAAGNIGGAIVDAVGIVADAASVVAPGIPGGASAGIKAIRAGKLADKAIDAARAVDKGVDGIKAADRVIDAAKAGDSAIDVVKGAEKVSSTPVGRVHGNSAASTKAQHAYDIVDESGNVVKTGVSGGPTRNGKSVRAETQVRKWNREVGYEKYHSTITHKEPAGEGARQKILDYEEKRALMLRQKGQLDPQRHKRP